MAETHDGSESGYVEPISTCPHFSIAKDTDNIDTSSPCKTCSNSHENWICLTCFEVGCSRFKNSHAMTHFEKTQHPLALSFSDLSIWCYECESYVKHSTLSKFFKLAHQDKFSAKPGVNTYTVSTTSPLEDLTEYYDDAVVVEQKVKELADIIRKSQNLVVYTGAGVSTSAKIPDYRGPQGVWTLRDQGLAPAFEVSLEQAVPTGTHMALVQLFKTGIMKFLVSTNVDGLHRRSGIPADAMSELHGNCYKESCSNQSCKKEYLRYFDASSSRSDHKTGRKCEQCGSPLLDSIINFGENLPEDELQKTIFAAGKSDVSLVLGTSMKVSPANKFPSESLKNGGKMIIVNLQKTPYDKKASMIIREKTDKVILMLFKELGLEIPPYVETEDTIKNLKNTK